MRIAFQLAAVGLLILLGSYFVVPTLKLDRPLSVNRPGTGIEIPTGAIPQRLIVAWQADGPVSKRTHRAQHRISLANSGNIELLEYADRKDWLNDFAELRHHSQVNAVQFDYPVKFRRTPNDTFFTRQQNLVRTGFDQVWNENTGGMTPDGEQIVIAILDAGFDIDHEDMAGNLWVNPAEISGDGIDNDGNGYRDDRHGWNFLLDNNTYPSDLHGTRVMGMLGASGNNEIGISGTGWNNQLMLFSILEVNHIIAAYDYIITQRQIWQDSNGSRGALVVVTNASFGLEGRDCSDFPVWANMYDRLGQVGILTAASTANRSWNVDNFGDMPTTCPSEFLLGVANSGENDRLASNSAYSPVSVDLAAPGQGTFTLGTNNNYGGFTSTSAAAPYVSGAIALLYSLPCERIQNLIRRDPAAAARLIRQSILQSVDQSDAYFNLLVTEGQLNVWTAWQQLKTACEQADNELSIAKIYPNPARHETFISFYDTALGPYRVELINSQGQLVKRYYFPSGSAFPLENRLDVGTLPRGAYQVIVRNEKEVSKAAGLVLQ